MEMMPTSNVINSRLPCNLNFSVLKHFVFTERAD